MTIHDRASAHCAHLPGEDQQLYMLGFNAGLRAGTEGGDTEGFLRSLLAADETASAAGFLEGCAAANLARPDLMAATAQRRWRNDSRAYRSRACRRRVA